MGRRKVCRFCADKTMLIDYKDSRTLGTFLTRARQDHPGAHHRAPARGHQRRLTVAVKQARTVALLPYTTVYP